MTVSTVLAALSVVSFNGGWEYKWDDDSAWKRTDVPHDAMWERPYDASESAQQGYIVGGFVTYRKRFPRPADGAASYAVRFDCAYMDAKVSLNGRPIGGRHNGYVPFEVPLEDLRDENVLEVVCDSRVPNARFYVGAGLMRDVWLVGRTGYALEPEHIRLETSVEGRTARVRVHVEGAEVVEPAGGELLIPDCPLWSPEHPNLRTIRVVARNAAGETDARTLRFGVKTQEFTRDRGLLLNGEPYRLKGVCMHETLGCLGGAWNRPAMRRMLLKYKEMGVNAIRTTHNPYAPGFFDLCDEMGFLVFDEQFDEWECQKSPYGYWRFFKEDCLRDFETIIRRDRNRACLLMWSIANEIRDLQLPDKPEGRHAREWAQKLSALAHRLDPAHPVSGGHNGPRKKEKTGAFGFFDVLGINYDCGAYEHYRGKYPLFGSETAAILSTRDNYLFTADKAKRRLEIRPSYGPWMGSHMVLDKGWWSPGIGISLVTQEKSPWSAGEFIWSACDYIGEPMVSNADYPPPTGARSAAFGCWDYACFPKDRFYLYQAEWSAKPMARLLPDWNFTGLKGYLVPVWCFTNGEEAELFLNGKSFGVRRRADVRDPWVRHLAWEVPYEPGALEVRARMKDGTVVTDVRRTPGRLAGYRVTTDYAEDGWSFLRIDAVDAAGTRIILCDDLVRIVVEGAELVATDNGDPACRVPFSSSVLPLFRGSLLAVVRSAPDAKFTVRAEAVR